MTQSARRPLRTRRELAGYVLLGVGVGFAAFFAFGRASPVLLGLASGGLMLWAGIWSCLKGGRVDEFQLASVKFAWMWGGFAGSAIGAGLAVWGAAASDVLSFNLAGYTPGEAGAFAAGIILMLAAQYLLYLVVLGGWLGWKSR